MLIFTLPQSYTCDWISDCCRTADAVVMRYSMLPLKYFFHDALLTRFLPRSQAEREADGIPACRQNASHVSPDCSFHARSCCAGPRYKSGCSRRADHRPGCRKTPPACPPARRAGGRVCHAPNRYSRPRQCPPPPRPRAGAAPPAAGTSAGARRRYRRRHSWGYCRYRRWASTKRCVRSGRKEHSSSGA